MNRLLHAVFLSGVLFLLSVSGVFAALGETENAITFRGDKRRIALPPVPAHVATAKGSALPEAEAKRLLGPVVKNIATQTGPGNALLTLAVEKSKNGTVVRLSHGKGKLPGEYSLPANAGKLRRAVAGYARYAGLRALRGGATVSGLQWTIQRYRPSRAGAANAVKMDNAFWELAETMTVDSRGASRQYGESALLTFSFTNTSREGWYVYLVNYTDDGQIVPVLPPEAQSGLRCLVPHGQTLNHPGLRLELGAPVERVRLIVSRVPISIAHWTQDSFNADPAEFEQAPSDLKAEDWASTEVVFSRK